MSDCKRFVLVGSESTGKTTLVKELAEHYRRRGNEFAHIQWVEEYGRAYTYEKLNKAQQDAKSKHLSVPGMDALVWTEEDFIRIALRQNEIENEACVNRSMVICDTDAFATAIWYERYCQSWSSALEKIVQQLPSRALYLLTDHRDIPFVEDEIRDGEHLRAWMTARFEQEMQKRNFSYIKLSGSHQERLETAVSSIDRCLGL